MNKKKKFLNTDPKIANLKEDGSYSVQDRSGLQLIKRGNSKYFVGNLRFPFNRSGKNIPVPIGVFEKDIFVDDALEKWKIIKKWSKENNKSPKLFGQDLVEESTKTFREVAEEYMQNVYRTKVQENVFKDRQNKLNQMLNFIGDEALIDEFEIDKGGRVFMKKMLQTVFHYDTPKYAPVQLTRCRQLISWIFNYAEDETYLKENQNPLAKKFAWETGTEKTVSEKTFADTIKKNSWGEVPEFLNTVNENLCNGDPITDFATKAHLLMAIRTGVIVRLEWSWFDPEENLWTIPKTCKGLKWKLREHIKKQSFDHLIPSTPEINELMSKVKRITGGFQYCFPSLGGKNNKHLGDETINDHFSNLGWKGKQTAHQWRSVITTAGQEHGKFFYEIIDRQLGRRGHLQGTRGHYDKSTLLPEREKFMTWWSKSLVEQGLII